MKSACIMIVEDNNEYRTYLKSILLQNYQVLDFENCDLARQGLQQQKPDLILLDIGLPNEDGFSFCSELKKNSLTSQIPVLFLTSKENIIDKVTGFSMGADDYMIKPIEHLELLARIAVPLRRLKQTPVQEKIIQKNHLKIDLALFRAYLLENSEEIDLRLTPTEFKILNYFMLNESRALTREQILTAIWGENTHVVDRAIDTHIHTLRKKLGAKSELIQSVFGEGYRFGRQI